MHRNYTIRYLDKESFFATLFANCTILTIPVETYTYTDHYITDINHISSLIAVHTRSNSHHETWDIVDTIEVYSELLKKSFSGNFQVHPRSRPVHFRRLPHNRELPHLHSRRVSRNGPQLTFPLLPSLS